MLPVPLQPMAAHRRFILWKLLGDTKVPVSPLTGQIHDAHDVLHHVDYNYAVQMTGAMPDHGVAFVITEQDGFWFLDIDKCLQPDGMWSPISQELCARLQGAAIEISQSGRGLHLFGRGFVPPHRCKNTALGLELYTDKRFVALTGTGAMGDANFDASGAMPGIVAQYFEPDGSESDAGAINWQDVARPEWSGPETDDRLLQMMLTARQSAAQVLGTRAGIADLWHANPAVLGAVFPDPRRPYDASSADAALAQHLAFWTGCNTERMRRLMLQSGLVRPKWEQHRRYLWLTITQACAKQTRVFGDRGTQQAPAGGPSLPGPVSGAPTGTPDAPAAQQQATAAASGTPAAGSRVMFTTNQIEHFAGCVYVGDQHSVLTPRGVMKPETFKVIYGGYDFIVDPTSGRSTKDAWEAFSNNRAVDFPKADGACFRPELAARQVITEESRTLVNVYEPIATDANNSDPSPFLNHLALMLPDERDRTIMLSYMAAIVQNPGIKLQWWPVIQGAEGNGKSMIARVLEHCVGRRYTHFPKADQLADSGMRFNGWLAYRLLIAIEEIKVGERVELLEALKDVVTNDRVEIQSKGRDQVVMDNRANGIMLTNHKDAIPTNADKRRYAIFYTAQQSREDIDRAGMTGTYFPRIYDWLRAIGYAAVNGYLRTYPIPEWMRESLMTRAPETSSTAEAVMQSMGPVEQEIIEACESCRPGFANGWISGYALDMLLKEIGRAKSISHRRRSDILADMGYIPHPHLLNGRVNNPIPFEGGKRPRLFVKKNSLLLQLTNAGEVTARYLKDQGIGAVVPAAVA